MIRVAQHPQGNGYHAQAGHANIKSGVIGMVSVLLAVIDRENLLQMGAGGDELATPGENYTEGAVGFHT